MASGEIFSEDELKGRVIPPCVFISVRENSNRDQLVANFRCASRQVAVTTTSSTGTRPSPAACLDDLCALLVPRLHKRDSGGTRGGAAAGVDGGGGLCRVRARVGPLLPVA